MEKRRKIILLRQFSSIIKNTRHPIHIYPPILLKNIQALLDEKKDLFQVRLIDCWIEDISQDEILEFLYKWPADVIVVLIDTFSIKENQVFLSRIENRGNIFLIGVGQGVTWKRNKFISEQDYLDVMIPGESELEVVNLLKELNQYERDYLKGKYRLRYEKAEPVEIVSLDEIPPLVWDKDELKKYRFVYPLRIRTEVVCGYIMSSRGCPHKCIFCSSVVRKSYGRKVRFASPQRIADEIAGMLKKKVNTICFEDENIAVSKKHITGICEEISRRKLRIKWIAHARIDDVDFELLGLMRKAGCILLLFGIESASQRIIGVLDKARININWADKAKEVFKLARKSGIATCALFIIGSPTETEQEVDESIKLAKELHPDLIKVHYFTPYPGSEAYEQFKDIIGIDQENNMYHYCKPVVNLSGMTDTILKRKQREFYRKVLLNPPFIISHLKNYTIFYLYNWKIGIQLIWKTFRFIFK